MIVDHVISVHRLKDDTDDSDKEQYQINEALRNVECQIQPASPADTAISGGLYGKTYLMFTTESGIKKGDRLTVSGTGETLRVQGIEDWDMDPAPHFELTLVEFEEERV